MEKAERKRAEAVLTTDQALPESEVRFRELADNISQFAWTADAKGWIYWYNKRWHDYTGTTLADMEGWGWQKVHHPDHVERVVRCACDAEQNFRFCRLQTTILILILGFQELVTPGPGL